MLMGRGEDALPWLQSSIAITPASGRTLHAAGRSLPAIGPAGRGKSGYGEGLELRPGSNLSNVALPPKNASPIFIAAAEWIRRAYVAAGLPER